MRIQVSGMVSGIVQLTMDLQFDNIIQFFGKHNFAV